MKRRLWLSATFALLFHVGTLAQGPAAPAAAGSLDTLKGRWLRLDGGYVITIRGIASDGKLNASYNNPSPLAFAKAEASRDGEMIKVFFELRAGGYDGSTYSLTYDPKLDVLKGVYYQAVAQQKFGVYFERDKR